MLFLRPQIIDSEDDINRVTKHQQDIFRAVDRKKRPWKYEVEQALEFFNVKTPCNPCEEYPCE
jgi:type III secretion protein C